MIYRFNPPEEQNKCNIMYGHLKMGGCNPSGEEIGVNSRYLTLKGKPWLPVMGEFHFSRYPSEYWEEELLKMKAGGIQIVSTYVFWIHHEETEGEFHWENTKNLRDFLVLCQKTGLYAIVRIGPWSHGECRNGGFPDWILNKCRLRTNDPEYLNYVRPYFKEIAAQLGGLLYSEGGPVIGVQLENELAHNPEHILRLKEIATELGIKVPVYTATGWGGTGGADIPRDEVLPLFGVYPDHPWAGHTHELDLSYKYFFSHVRNDLSIGADILGSDDTQMAYNPPETERYPFACCEIGPGVQVTYHRRPVIRPEDVASLSLIKLGSGNNLVGYYMFHGGSNPLGKCSTMQESRETGYPNDVPVISYDFQAPLGEYGQVRPHYGLLKVLHLFLGDFGEELATMISVLPEVRPESSRDIRTLRCAVRVGGSSGYLFVSDYQRHTDMPEKKNIKFQVQLENEILTFPQNALNIRSNAYFFMPFNMNMGGALLKYATAQPLCRIDCDAKTVYFFFEPEGIEAEYVFDSGTISKLNPNGASLKNYEKLWAVTGLKPGCSCVFSAEDRMGRSIEVVTLTQRQAENAWKGQFMGRDSLILTEAGVIFRDDSISLYSTDNSKIDFSVFPYPPKSVAADGKTLEVSSNGIFAYYSANVEKKEISVNFRRSSPRDDIKSEYLKYFFTGEKELPEWSVRVEDINMDNINDVFLKIDYIGDVAQIYDNGSFAADDFYSGQPWVVGLKRFKKSPVGGWNFTIKLSPLRQGAAIYIEDPMESEAEEKTEILNIEALPEYIVNFRSK